MKLVPDWRHVVATSLSFWMQAAGLLLLVLIELRFVLTGVDTDPVFAWWLGVLFLLAGLAGRLFQQGLSPWREWLRLGAVAVLVFLAALALASTARAAAELDAGATAAGRGDMALPYSEAAALDVAVPFIAQEEGLRTKAYLDIVGVPTICYGSTRGVRLGMEKTRAECLELLRSEVAEYRHGLHRYIKPATRLYHLTPKRDAAYTSTAFNCGIQAIGKSTAVRRLNAGDIRGGCEALTWWNKAGGRVVRGLVARRTRERALCLEGVR